MLSNEYADWGLVLVIFDSRRCNNVFFYSTVLFRFIVIYNQCLGQGAGGHRAIRPWPSLVEGPRSYSFNLVTIYEIVGN